MTFGRLFILLFVKADFARRHTSSRWVHMGIATPPRWLAAVTTSPTSALVCNVTRWVAVHVLPEDASLMLAEVLARMHVNVVGPGRFHR